MFALIVFAAAALAALAQASDAGDPPPSGGFAVVTEFTMANYTFEDADATTSRAQYMDTGAYRNNSITGIKYHAGRTWLTVPRWRPGVPGTLNELVHSGGGRGGDAAAGVPLLRPWPSWASQEVGNCSAIQYVQSMEIDSSGIMWVVDVGRRNFAFTGMPPDNACPPKLVLLDTATGARVDAPYVFPDSVASYNASFLNDIVVDQVLGRAFISDAGTGAVVVYDRKRRASRRYADASTANDPSVDFDINGVDYGTHTFTTPADGIALTADRTRLFYCALQGLHLYSVDALKLGDMDTPLSEVAASQVDHGAKPAQADGMVWSRDGRLFSGGLNTDTLYQWAPRAADGARGNVSRAFTALATDPERLQWIDTFAWDNPRRTLLLTSNRLDRFFEYTMDFSGARGPNFRVLAVAVNTTSYLDGGRN